MVNAEIRYLDTYNRNQDETLVVGDLRHWGMWLFDVISGVISLKIYHCLCNSIAYVASLSIFLHE